jgi:TPR repeat protein
MNEEQMNPKSIYMMAKVYYQGSGGLQQDHSKAMELLARAAELGFSTAHYNLGRHL